MTEPPARGKNGPIVTFPHTFPIHPTPTWVKLSSPAGGSSQIATGTGNGLKTLVSSTGSKTLTGARGVDSIGSDGDSSSWQESIGLSGKLVRDWSRNEAKQARYTCNIRRSLSHERNKRATHVIYVVLKAMRRNKRAIQLISVIYVVLLRSSWREPSALHMWYGSFQTKRRRALHM